MLKLLKGSVFLLAMMMFTAVFAAEQADVNSQVQAFMQDLQAKADLSAEQKTQVEAILKDSMTQREAVLAKYQGQKGMGVKKDIRNELEPINESTRTQVQKVLTPEQYQAFLDVQEARQQQLRDRINSQF